MMIKAMFRQTLPALLSAAMIFTSVPQYAMAGYIQPSAGVEAADVPDAAAQPEDPFSEDLKSAESEADLAGAVAPRSLKFSNVPKSLAVGETMQLDVSITKKQMSDIIWLGYGLKKEDDKSILNVMDNGFISALKVGTATVEVYPCRLENGVKTRIEGAISAAVSVKVKDVTAPRIRSVVAVDDSIIVKYMKPADGIRREIYIAAVPAGSKNFKKPADFEKKIKEDQL